MTKAKGGLAPFVDSSGQEHAITVKRSRFRIVEDLVGVRRRATTYAIEGIGEGVLEEVEVSDDLSREDFDYIMDAESVLDFAVSTALGEVFGENAARITAAYGNLLLCYNTTIEPAWEGHADLPKLGTHLLQKVIGSFGIGFVESRDPLFDHRSGFVPTPADGLALAWCNGNPDAPPLPLTVGAARVPHRSLGGLFNDFSLDDFEEEDAVAETLLQLIEGDDPEPFVSEIRQTLARRLRLFADDFGSISQVDIAESAGVSRRAVATLFKGETSKGLDDALRILWALDALPHQAFDLESYFDVKDEFGRPLEPRVGGLFPAPPQTDFALDPEQAWIDAEVALLLHNDPRTPASTAAQTLMTSLSSDADPSARLITIRRALELDPACVEALMGLDILSDGRDITLPRRILAAATARLSEQELTDWSTSTPAQTLYLEARLNLAAALLDDNPTEAALHAREVLARDPNGSAAPYLGLACLRSGLLDEWAHVRDTHLGGDSTLDCYIRTLGRFVVEGPIPGPTAELVALIRRKPDAARAIAGVSHGPAAVLRAHELSRNDIDALNTGIWLHLQYKLIPGATAWLRRSADAAGVALVDLRGLG